MTPRSTSPFGQAGLASGAEARKSERDDMSARRSLRDSFDMAGSKPAVAQER
jgi:hypothetical protein